MLSQVTYTVDKEHKVNETAYEAHSDNDVRSYQIYYYAITSA